MKSFILGVLLTLVCGLGVQNHILTQELNNHMRESHKENIKKNPKIKQARVKVKKQNPIQVVASEEERELDYLENRRPQPSERVETKTAGVASYDPRDPRCPSTAPYYNERWGCIVIPR